MCRLPSTYLPLSIYHIPLSCAFAGPYFASRPLAAILCFEPLSAPIGHTPLPRALAIRRRHAGLLCARTSGQGQVGKWAWATGHGQEGMGKWAWASGHGQAGMGKEHGRVGVGE